MVAEPAKVTRIDEERARRDEERGNKPRPVACMTGVAKDIGPAILKCAMSQKAKQLMAEIAAEAMGNAGFETHHPEEAGLWCDMDTEGWAESVECSKRYIAYLTDQLVTYRMVSRHIPQNWQEAISCRLRINPKLGEWEPLQEGAHTRRYAKPGAGRPHKIASEHGEPDYFSCEQQATVANQISDSHSASNGAGRGHTVTDTEPHPEDAPTTIRNKSGSPCSVDEIESGSLRQPAKNKIWLATHGSLEGTAEEASEGALRTPPRKNSGRKNSGDPSIDQSGLPGMDFTEEELSLLSILRTLKTCPPQSQQDRHMLNTLLYVEKKPLPWLLHQASIMVAWALKHPKRCCDQAYFIRWCSFPAATEDYERWKQQEAAKTQRNGQSASRRPTTEDDRAALAASRASVAAQKASPREKPNYLR